MPLSLFLALRFFREGRMQSLLIVVGVSVGVAVMVFLSALMEGLQTSLVEQTLGTQAHIVVRPPEERPRSLRGASVAARVERTAQRVRSLEGWQECGRRLVDCGRRRMGSREKTREAGIGFRHAANSVKRGLTVLGASGVVGGVL